MRKFFLLLITLMKTALFFITSCQKFDYNPVIELELQTKTSEHVAKEIYYVDPAGSDAAIGTSQAPWKTIAYAISQVKPGDTIFLKPGATFLENINITPGVDRTATSPIKLSSDKSERAIIAPTNMTKEGLRIWNTGGVVVENLVIEGAGMSLSTKSGIALHTDNAQHEGITIRNVDVSGFNEGLSILGWGDDNFGFINILIEDSSFHHNLLNGCKTWSKGIGGISNIIVRRCRFYSNPGDPNATQHTGSGIVLGSVVDGLIEHCTAFDNGVDSRTVGGPVGIWTYDSTRVTIQYCVSYSNHAQACDGGGFDLDRGVQDCIIQYCYSHDNDGAGYLFCQLGDGRAYNNNTIRYNISVNDARRTTTHRQGGISITSWGTGEFIINNTKIYGNTIYNKIRPAMQFQNISGQQGTKIWNNIFITSGQRIIDGNPTTAVAQFQGNLYWTTGDVYIASYTSLDAWRSANKQEILNGQPTGLYADPLLTNPGASYIISDTTKLATLTAYQLLPASPAIDSGLNLQALFTIDPGPRDFYGNPVPSGTEGNIGAHE